MAGIAQRWDRERLASAGAVALLHALLGYAFMVGLGVGIPQAIDRQLKVFRVAPELPPPPVEQSRPKREKAPRKEGAAAPKNIESRASPVIAPKPPVIIPLPPPVIAAPVPRQGDDRTAGASPLPGPGTGSGGQGTGTGSGSAGDGPGGGGGGTPLRWRSGSIRNSDYPRAALQAGVSGTVQLSFTVGTNGRVSDCRVTGSSGNADLDATTCRLILKRFRYWPKRDAAGRPVPTVVMGEHEWYLVRRPDAEVQLPPDEP